MSHPPPARAVGLFYTQAHLDAARAARGRPPVDAAWAWLESPTPTQLEHGAAPLNTALLGGLRWHLTGDAPARDAALAALGAQPQPEVALPPEDDAARLVGWGQACVQLIDALPPEAVQRWQQAYHAQASTCDAALHTPVQQAWQAALRVVAGVVLGDGALLSAGVDAVQAWVRERARPNGTLPEVLQQADDGQSLARQLSASCALVLAAEAATHAGHPLWAYEVRGVSVRTPALYAAYHSLAPSEWPWDAPLPQEQHDALYRAHAGFLEMLARQIRPYLLEDTLAALRPIYAPTGGGLTTLTHALPEPTRRKPDAPRGLFGRLRR